MTTTGTDGPQQVLTNWAGNYRYRAARLVEPTSVEELQETVAGAARVRALGSRHSFTDIADTEGTLVSTSGLPASMELDRAAGTVTVSGAARYGEVAESLHRNGLALANLASLPHISVAGAVATGTHGSGDHNQSLAAAVTAMEAVGPDGARRVLSRGEAGFPGSVVSLGALGIVTRLTLEVEPAFELRQDVWTDLPWSAVESHFDELTASAYSVSLFTDWTSDTLGQVWLKSRGSEAPDELFGATAATTTWHILRGAPTESVTEQLGVIGPWHERLPHFRLSFTPSRGEELQSEYLVPRASALDAFAELRRLGPRLAPLLQSAEIRTVAAEDLWLSASYGRDVVGIHFTWVRDPEAVYAVLPAVEEVVLPLGGRPHWGKCFVASAAELAPLYPRFEAFRELRDRVDPERKFGNAFLDRVLG